MRRLNTIKEDVKEHVWRLRCKVAPPEGLLDKSSGRTSTEDDTDTQRVSNKSTVFGADPTIKTMYESRGSELNGRYEWVDYPPKQLSKSAALAQDKVAIKLYKIKDRDKPCIAGRYSLKYHKVEVQNPLLVAALEPILKKEALHLDVHEPATFEEPFQPLWFCQDDIVALFKATDKSEPLHRFLELFVRVLDELFGNMRVKRRHQLVNGLVDFASAWALFPRGSVVYSHGLNSESLWKVEGTKYLKLETGQMLAIKSKFLAFNGSEYVWQEKALPIKSFEGKKKITDLAHYPFDFHPEKNDILKRLTLRGQKALDFQGLRYCCYSGIALQMGERGIERHNVEGRIIVDVVGYNKYHLVQGQRENSDPKIERYDTGQVEKPKDATTDAKGLVRRVTDDEAAKNKERMLAKEEDLCFVSDLVGGYALKNKEWVQFYVEDIEPMVWNEEAYSHLVYDEQQKDLILSFVEHHARKPREPANSPSPSDDVIIGKGQGLIVLLSGPPGTGKTLTAEAVADRTKRPLFYLQAEDLGVNPAQLGANLKRVFAMATEWNAVVLLDEADVFMAERNPNDVHRNELVSIFLRELEYFRGIIFLTTNLYSTIDSAFRSRVSLHLVFHELSRAAREVVWRKFLQRLPDGPLRDSDSRGQELAASGSSSDRPVDEEDLHELSLWQLNGREIKIAVNMAHNWCGHKGYVMTLARLESGIRVTTPHASKEGDVDNDFYD